MNSILLLLYFGLITIRNPGINLKENYEMCRFREEKTKNPTSLNGNDIYTHSLYCTGLGLLNA